MESENEFDLKNNHPEERTGDDLIEEILGNDGEKEQEEKEQQPEQSGDWTIHHM